MKHIGLNFRVGLRARIVLSIATCLSMSVAIAQSEAIRVKSIVPEQHDQRPVTVPDAIRMTQFGDFSYMRGLSSKYNLSRFSPSGKYFVIVTATGDLDKNTNDYSLLLFQSDTALRSPTPEVLVSLSSSSNRPGIQDIKWIDDRTVAFLGENPGEVQQVYEVDCQTRQLTRLTNHATGIVSYAINPEKDSVFFLAERPEKPLLDERSRRDGLAITNQPLPDLIAGERRLGSGSGQVMDLFMKRGTEDQETPVRTRGDLVSGPLWLSPTGRYLIVTTSVVSIPESWRDYESRSLQTRIRRNARLVHQYELISIDSGEMEALLDAPEGGGVCIGTSVIWSPDSNSVVVSGTYLPLSVTDPAERKLRQAKRMMAEVRIPSLEIVSISAQEVCPLTWDSKSGNLLVASTSFADPRSVSDLHAFQKTAAAGWKEVEFPRSGLGQGGQIALTLEEDMNTPPRLFVSDAQTGKKSLLLDFNPQFKDLQFGRVQDVTFKATDGHDVRAGLYLPANYVQGKRYPLVIQTHGWDPQRFWIDGAYSSASAAQPLAGRGFIVVQVEADFSITSTPEEAPREASAYEGAIEYLDRLGIVDRDRVGVVGFSRTGLPVEYALTHSKYHFAAATLAEQSDVGYFTYLSLLPTPGWSWRSVDFENINGGLPFGNGLTSWMKNSPGFNLSRVNTPVREEVYRASVLIWSWEWFAGLSRLGKPVELVYMPDGDHALVKPSQRMASQQGNVDWFSFWLQDYEDPNPAKAEQYKRWRELRKLQEANTGKQM